MNATHSQDTNSLIRDPTEHLDGTPQEEDLLSQVKQRHQQTIPTRKREGELRKLAGDRIEIGSLLHDHADESREGQPGADPSPSDVLRFRRISPERPRR